MSERPFMQLYVSDFVGDTLSLSSEEIGAYVLLLCAGHNSGPLLEDHEVLARIARLPSERWASAWVSIARFFDRVDGHLVARHPIQWERDRLRLEGRTPLSAATRDAVVKRDGARCRYCGDYNGPFHIDHVIPVALGGTDDLDNLVVACKPCNLSKGAKRLEDWLQ